MPTGRGHPIVLLAMNILTAPFVVAGKLLKLSPLAAAGGVAYSATMVDHDLPLPSPVAVEPSFVAIPGRGRVAFYQHGPAGAPPVLLVHSVNAAASAAEMRPLFDVLGTKFAVTALDLPGYGRSDREPISYDTGHMTAAVVAALESVGRPCHIVALSLGAEFAAKAETLRPDLVASLTMISPTGFGTDDAVPPQRLGDFIRTPVIGQALYDALVSRPSLNFYLAKSFVGDIDPGLLSYSYLTSHQPNARFAPAAFLSGVLFTRHATEVIYSRVTAPTRVLFDEDPYSSFAELAPFTSRTDNWGAVRIPGTRGLPQFDALDRTVDAITDFIGDIPVEV